MPFVKIEVTREGVTKAQKQALIKGVPYTHSPYNWRLSLGKKT